MTPLVRIARLIFASDRAAFLRGFALAVTVIAMGTALLGLSGWFITAAAAAGLVGAGAVFNVFVPSALVRFLALGRTAARYGERLATHDATLSALAGLRVRLLTGLLGGPWRSLERLRAGVVLNRVTSDVDALDGLALRLLLPGMAGTVVICGAAVALWVLVAPAVALVVGLGYFIGPTAVFLLGQRIARAPARLTESATQAARSRLIDLVAARDDLVVFGQIGAARDHVGTALHRMTTHRTALDRVERRTGAALDLIGGAITAVTLGLGATLAEAGTISAAQAAIGVFVSLALSETAAPVRRALAEIGRMSPAARRMLPSVTLPDPAPMAASATSGGTLQFDQVSYRATPDSPEVFAPVSLVIAPGETVALTGPSGAGKSTLMYLAAGVLAPSQGTVRLGGTALPEIDPEHLRQQLSMVPQRHGLIAGTIAENLRLAAPDAQETMIWDALEAVALADTIYAKGGLETRLGPRGAGLSGGEARRLVLARAILHRPQVLLLDEPTEGLDRDTAEKALAGVRAALPQTAILIAAHRAAELAVADRTIALRASVMTPPR